MTFLRLLKETDTEIHASTKNMEVPGVECIHVEIPQTTIDNFRTEFVHLTTSQEYPVTFENGRVETCYLSSALPTEYIFTKR